MKALLIDLLELACAVGFIVTIVLFVFEIVPLKQRGVMIEIDKSGKVTAIRNTTDYAITNLKFDVVTPAR